MFVSAGQDVREDSFSFCFGPQQVRRGESTLRWGSGSRSGSAVGIAVAALEYGVVNFRGKEPDRGVGVGGSRLG